MAERKHFFDDPKAALAEYHKKGYYIEPGMLTPEDCADVIAYAREKSVSNTTKTQIPLLIHYSQHPLLVRIAQQLVGGEVEGLHVEYCFEEPGNKAIEPHQDSHSLQVPSGAFFTVTIALEDTERESGATVIWEGSHDEGVLAPVEEGGKKTVKQKMEECKEVACSLKKGDVLFHHGDVVNAKDKNTSKKFAPIILSAYIRKGTHYRSGSYFAKNKKPIGIVQDSYSPVG